MGALTLKNYPFELRGWDIKKFNNIDTTDGFGSNINVYTSKNQVVQIEPNYDTLTFTNWITDKSRLVFDGILNKLNNNQTNNNNKSIHKKHLLNIFKNLEKILYIQDHSNNINFEKNYFLIVFEDVSIEILSLLNIISQKYSFIKIKKFEKSKSKNDLESSFQLNLDTKKTKLSKSHLCLLISNNPRYEGFVLNLNLRQRYLKGNFKCYEFGSILDLTFPIKYLGSNTQFFKFICEGNHVLCQDLRYSKKPILIFNKEINARTDGENITNEIIKTLKYSNIFDKIWYGNNTLNPSLYDTGSYSTSNFSSLNFNNLLNFSIIYFINIINNNSSIFKKITKIKLLKFSYLNNKKFVLESSKQNNQKNFENISDEKKINFFYLPVSSIYENEETFINTEGSIKKTKKILFKKTKNSWQLLRKIFLICDKRIVFLNTKNNFVCFLNLKKLLMFRNYINFQYQATQSLTKFNHFLNEKNKPFKLKQNKIYKFKNIKIQLTKLKYWLDDFFIGGKDSYSHQSLSLIKCSDMARKSSTNFF